MRETSKFRLPLWDAEDPVRRGDFNRESETLEAALGALDTDLSKAVFQRSGGAALTSRTGGGVTIPSTQISGRVRIVTGSYTGNGTNQVRITFAGLPSLVVIYGKGRGPQEPWPGHIILHKPLTRVQAYIGQTFSFDCQDIQWGGNYISWNGLYYDYVANVSGERYTYLALCE